VERVLDRKFVDGFVELVSNIKPLIPRRAACLWGAHKGAIGLDFGKKNPHGSARFYVVDA